MPKKSFYLFMAAMLGTLLFLMLDRIIVFIYLYLQATGYITATYDYYQFLFWDYFILTLAMMMGAWYGISLGLYWFRQVYEEKTHQGLIHHLATHYFVAGKPKDLEHKMDIVREKIAENLLQMEDLTQTGIAIAASSASVKRKIVRKRSPKKLNGVK